MASEKTLRRVTKVLQDNSNISDQDLLDRFSDIKDQDELTSIKDSVLKKKDSTSTSLEESMESTTEEVQEPTSLESSPTEVETPSSVDDSEEGDPLKKKKSKIPRATTDEKPVESIEQQPQVDQSWKLKYKEITGLNPDDYNITFEQAESGFIPKSIKFKGLSYDVGDVNFKDVPRSKRRSLNSLKRKFKDQGAEVFGKGGIYYKSNFENAQQQLKDRITSEPVEVPEKVIEVGLVDIEENTPVGINQVDQATKDDVISTISKQKPDLDLDRSQVTLIKTKEKTGKKLEAPVALETQIDVEEEKKETTLSQIEDLKKEIEDIQTIIDSASEGQDVSDLETRKRQKEEEIDVYQDISTKDEEKEVVTAIIVDPQGVEQSVVVSEQIILPELPEETLSPVQERIVEQTKEADKEVKKQEFKEKVSSHRRLHPESDITTRYNTSEINKAFDDTEFGEAPTKVLDVVGNQVITSKEEESVPFINSVYNDYGIEAEQTGIGNAMIVKAVDKDGNVTDEIRIDLNIPRTNLDLPKILEPITGSGEGDLGVRFVNPADQRIKIEAEKNKLKSFIEKNATKEETEIKKIRSEQDKQIDLEEINAINSQISTLQNEYLELNKELISSAFEKTQIENQLKEIIQNESSSFEDVQEAAKQLIKIEDELEDIFENIDAKKEVIDELKDESIAIVAQSIKYYEKYQIYTGPYEMNFSDEYSYWTQTFMNAVTDPLLGLFIGALEILRAPFGGMTKRDREFLRKDAEGLKDFLGLSGDIPQEKIDDIQRQGGFGRDLLTVLTEMTGNAVAAVLALGPVGMASLMTTLPTSSAAMVYERLSKRMDEDPLFDDVPENHKTALKLAVGVMTVLLEKLGLKASVGNINVLASKIISDYFVNAGTRANMKGLIGSIIEFFSNPQQVIRLLGAAGGEGLTEAAQGGAQKVFQNIFNDIQNEKLFTDREIIANEGEIVRGLGEDTLYEFTLGAASGGMINTVISISANQKNQKATIEQIKAALSLSTDPNAEKGLEGALKAEIANGKITAEQANSIMNEVLNIKKAYEENSSFPNLTSEQRLDLTVKTLELNQLEQSRSNATTKRTQKAWDNLINIKESEINKIIESAVPVEPEVQVEPAIPEPEEVTEPTPEPEEVMEPAPEPTDENDIVEARKIASFAISRDNNLTLEELSQVAELMPDLDIDISTDRDIKADELLTKINDYAVQREKADSVQDTREEGPESRPEGEMEVPQRQEEVQDEKQVETDEVKKAGFDFTSIFRTINNWFMGRDKAGNPNPKGFKEFIDYLNRVALTSKRFLPQAFKDIVESEISFRNYIAKKGSDLIKDYNAAIRKIKDKSAKSEAKIASQLYLNGLVPKEFFEGSKTKEEVISDLENEKKSLTEEISNLEDAKADIDPKDKNAKKMKDGIDSKIANLEDRLETIQAFENLKILDVLNPESMPDDVFETSVEMRSLIDDMTRQIIDLNRSLDMINEETIDVMEENLGSYLKRSYQVFSDKNWFKKVSNDVLENAAQNIFNKYIEQGQSPELAAENTKRDIERYTSKKGKEILEKGIKNPVKQKSKKKVPLEIRMLMGQYGDAVQQFAQTIQSQSSKVASMKAIKDVIDLGLKTNVIFDSQEAAIKAHPDGSHNNEFIVGGKTYYSNEGMAYELNDPETTGVKRKSEAARVIDALVKGWQKLVGAYKYGLTVLSPATQAINFTGNTAIAANNGHLNLTKFPEVVKTFRKNGRELYNYLIKEGVINSSVSLEMVEDLLQKTPEDALLESANQKNTQAARLFNLLKGLPKKSYEVGDDFWKIYGFLNEAGQYSLSEYGKSYNNLTPEEKKIIDKKAADIIKDIYPNYSKISDFVRGFKSLPVASPFLSFTYESFRIQLKNLKLAYQEISDPNPMIKAIGVKRLAGIGGTTAALSAILSSAQEEEDMDRDTPEGKAKFDQSKRYTFFWQENSDIVPLSIENGVYRYIDATASNPFGPSRKMVNAWDPEKDIIQNTIEMIKVGGYENFVTGDILAQTIKSLIDNESDYGGEIYKNEDNADVKSDKIINYIKRKLSPGIIKFIDKSKDMGYKDIGMSLIGLKPFEVDMRKQFEYKAGEFGYGGRKREIQDAVSSFIDKGLSDQGYKSIDDYIDKNFEDILNNFSENFDQFVGEDGYLKNVFPTDIKGASVFLGLGFRDFKDEFEGQNEKYREMVSELHKDYKALVEAGGVPEKEALEILSKKGFDAKEQQEIVSNAPREIRTKFTKKFYNSLYKKMSQMSESERRREGVNKFYEFYKGQRLRIPMEFEEAKTAREALKKRLKILDLTEEEYNNAVDTLKFNDVDLVDMMRFKN